MRSKQNLRFKPHRIGVTAVETWTSPVTEERLSLMTTVAWKQ